VNDDCVVDASVGIKLFLLEELADHAHTLFSRLTGVPPSRLFVPDLFFVECTNILWKYSRRYNYPLDNAQQNIADLISLPLHVVSTAELVQDALSLAGRYEITAYDAVYVALGHRLGLPFITADEKLVRKLSKAGIDIRDLGEFASS